MKRPVVFLKRRGVLKKRLSRLRVWNFSVYLHPKSSTGALAHLARALDWQSKGDEFESRMLHMDKKH